VLTPRREHRAALLALPCLGHHPSPTHVTRNSGSFPDSAL
jgi:hypothetical protein